MVTLKLARIGKKSQASFRLIATDKRRDPYGRALEILGHYSPREKKATINAERVKHWFSKGAQATDTVWNLLIKEKIVEGAKRKAHASTQKPAAEAKVEPAAPKS